MSKRKGRRSASREYYDPGKNPKPRAILGGLGREATVKKETRQLRRQRERAARKGEQ